MAFNRMNTFRTLRIVGQASMSDLDPRGGFETTSKTLSFRMKPNHDTGHRSCPVDETSVAMSP